MYGFFFLIHNPFRLHSLSSAARLGDTVDLQSFIDSLDRELSGAYLKELHPLSLNLPPIPAALRLTSVSSAVSYARL